MPLSLHYRACCSELSIIRVMISAHIAVSPRIWHRHYADSMMVAYYGGFAFIIPALLLESQEAAANYQFPAFALGSMVILATPIIFGASHNRFCLDQTRSSGGQPYWRDASDAARLQTSWRWLVHPSVHWDGLGLNASQSVSLAVAMVARPADCARLLQLSSSQPG